jgi:hypothetical protein
LGAALVHGPIKGTKRWDRKAIDLALDKASEIARTRRPRTTHGRQAVMPASFVADPA